MNKISKEFGQLSGEELFKPITKRLAEKSSIITQEVEESPDYAMDEFVRTNPFGEKFRPDAPSPLPPPPPPYQYDGGGDLPPPPPSSQPLEETSKRKEWEELGPVKLEYPNESILLQQINRLITIKGHVENYTVRESTLGLKGKTIAEPKK